MEAELLLREALETSRRVRGDEHPSTLIAIKNMGGVLRGQGKLTEAEPYYREALEISRRVLGDQHPDTLISISNIAEGEPYFREALEISRRMLGDGHPDTLTSINDLGKLLRDVGQLEEAESLGAEAVNSGLVTHGPDHGRVADFMGQHARTLTAMNRFADAESVIIKAHAIFVAEHGPIHRRTIVATKELLTLYTAWHEAEPAGGYDAKAAEWRAKLPAEDPADGDGE